MLIYLLTGFFVVYCIVLFLCSELKYPKAAKAGFIMMAIGGILMIIGPPLAFTSLSGLWVAPEKMDDTISSTRQILTVLNAGLVILATGFLLSLFSCLYRIITRRKELVVIKKPPGKTQE